MIEDEIPDPFEEEMSDRQRRIADYHAQQRNKRKAFLDDLLGTCDKLEWQAPKAIEDFDALLGEHAAQLRNAARYVMGRVLLDDANPEQGAAAASALTRLIQTNISIARVLATAKSKTVRGGVEAREPQD